MPNKLGARVAGTSLLLISLFNWQLAMIEATMVCSLLSTV